MKLDEFHSFSELDPQDMISEIDNLPDQLLDGWTIGNEQSLPVWDDIDRICIAGMGGSAIAADLLAAYSAGICPVSIVTHRNYDLPRWAQGPGTLVIASSHSGNTEETLSAFSEAVIRKCKVLAISTGGKLTDRARESGQALYAFNHQGQPRAAVGYSFGLLLSVLSRLNLIADPQDELRATVRSMREQQKSVRIEVPIAENPAKRIAGQWIGRLVVVIGADVLEPVARRWKGQISEVGKAWAQYEALPEVDHNSLAGVNHPEDLMMKTTVMFLEAPSYHHRNQLRTRITQRIFMVEGLNTALYKARGDSPLEHIWTALHFGDYASYYLAMSYGVDPSEVPTIEGLKVELNASQ